MQEDLTIAICTFLFHFNILDPHDLAVRICIFLFIFAESVVMAILLAIEAPLWIWYIHLFFAVCRQDYFHIASELKPITWWRHQMETFFALLAICAGNSPVPGEFPTQRPVTQSFDVYFDLSPNKRLSKHSWGWWFETLSGPLWRHSNDAKNTESMTNTRSHSNTHAYPTPKRQPSSVTHSPPGRTPTLTPHMDAFLDYLWGGVAQYSVWGIHRQTKMSN